jgi:16S rRNA (adenine1518-N6/adenine1519-N6)-dimethyltransferase
MLQREVVERIVAKPGGKEYGYLSVIVQFYCDAQKLFDVPPTAFKPRPKVYSSVVRLATRKEPPAQVRSEGNFIRVAQTIFAHRRKTLLNNLRAGAGKLALKEAVSMDDIAKESGIDLGRRGETLSIQEIARLADACQNAS